MNYLKSTIAGLIAVIVVFIILPVVALGAFALVIMAGGLWAGFGVDVPRWHFVSANPLAWLFVAAVFFTGFYWKYRRLSRQPR